MLSLQRTQSSEGGSDFTKVIETVEVGLVPCCLVGSHASLPKCRLIVTQRILQKSVQEAPMQVLLNSLTGLLGPLGITCPGF